MATVTVSQTYSAAPETVFDAWVEPAIASQWLFRTPDGELLAAEFDARTGGSFNVTERREDVDAAHLGTYVEVQRPNRLVFDFVVEPYSNGESTRVSVDIAATDFGSELRLTHEGVWDDWAEKTQQGWEILLGKLGETL